MESQQKMSYYSIFADPLHKNYILCAWKHELLKWGSRIKSVEITPVLSLCILTIHISCENGESFICTCVLLVVNHDYQGRNFVCFRTKCSLETRPDLWDNLSLVLSNYFVDWLKKMHGLFSSDPSLKTAVKRCMLTEIALLVWCVLTDG